MKILYHHRIRSKDGQYVHVEEMITALRELGHEIVLVGPGAITKEEFGADAGGVAWLKRALPRAVYEQMEFAYSAVAFGRLWGAVRRHRPDCIYERYNLFLPAGVWIKRIFGLPMLLEVNAPLAEERQAHGGLSCRRLARWSEKYTWRGADAVLAVTRVLAEYVRKSGVPDLRIVVVPNGISRARLRQVQGREEAKRALGLEGKLVIGFTGFMRDWHGLDRILDVVAGGAGAERHLLLVGDGPARRQLEERIGQMGLAENVTITGVVPRDKVLGYVAAFDVAVQPAVVPYASPLKLFEYMALECAIVAPASANILEVLKDGENALLFPLNDFEAFRAAINRLCGDEGLRGAISRRAKQTIFERGLTWEDNARRVVEHFQSLLNASTENGRLQRAES